jgi:hypothetical protein
MKIPEFKRSGIRLITEIRGIPNGFPIQASKCCLVAGELECSKLNVQWLARERSKQG